MHSSRIHTICCSGHLSCHTFPPPCTPPTTHAPLPCMFPLLHTLPAIHTPCHTCPLHHAPPLPYTSPLCHTCPPPPHMAPFTMHAPHGQNDRCLWNHYLSVTTVADGNDAEISVRQFRLEKLLMAYESQGSTRMLLHLSIFIFSSFLAKGQNSRPPPQNKI